MVDGRHEGGSEVEWKNGRMNPGEDIVGERTRGEWWEM
jgi:hypothetical protein